MDTDEKDTDEKISKSNTQHIDPAITRRMAVLKPIENQTIKYV